MTKHYILYYSYHCKVIKQRTLPVFYLILQMSIYLSASSVFTIISLQLTFCKKLFDAPTNLDLSILGLGRSPGEKNGNPLLYSCLENPMYGWAWWSRVHRVIKNWTQLSNWTELILKEVPCALEKNCVLCCFWLESYIHIYECMCMK